ncbi:nucleotidyltransferase domain-containing protein [Gottfriedia sp. NPDC056225]|uniref:nucleotidyltransferase domain-containing protein n=1 Tax=Gottfriedia sp. NPDC056225 TaxID=3345751 RepID=UPI0035DAD9EF
MVFNECFKINQVMKGFNKGWYIAGGWAIDLYLGKETRNHHDIEIAIARKDQLSLKEYLNDWTFNKVLKGELTNWKNEYLELPIHELHGRNSQTNSELEVLLNEIEFNEWKFRRDKSIICKLDSFYSFSNEGIPYLNPEIVLLYKVSNTREKDHEDFKNVINSLNEFQKKWLREAILRNHPNHEWLEGLN